MYCSVCQAPLPPGATHCPRCGAATPAYYSSSQTAPNDPTVASSSANRTPPLPPTMYGPQPYGTPPPTPYGPLPPSPYEPYNTPLPPPPPPSPPQRGNRMALLIGIALLVLIVIGGSIAALLSSGGKLASSPATPTVAPANATTTAAAHETATITSALTATVQANATATASVIAANPNPYPPGDGTLALYDPLRDNSKGYRWDEGSSATGSCAFSGNTYHVSTPRTHFFVTCSSNASDFSNFVFEAQMQIINGDCAGLIFRANSTIGKFYLFQVCKDGAVRLYLYLDYSGNHVTTLATTSSSAVVTGLNQTNVLAVIARGKALDFYVNKNKSMSVNDGTFTHGQIGFVASAANNPTEVMYSNTRVWTL